MTAELITVPLASIAVSPQPRTLFDDESIEGLAESIEQSGLQQPLLCIRAEGGLRLIDGERRLRAMRLLGLLKTQALVVTDPLEAADILSRQLICNMQRKDLGPIDRAAGIRSLMERASLTGDAVAKRLGLSPATVSRSLRLLDLPDELQSHVASGAIPPDIGYRLSGIADDAERTRLAEEVLGNRLTREALTRKLTRVRRAQESRRGSRVTASLGGGRTVTVSGDNLSLDTLAEWLEQLLVKTRKARSQGLTLQTFARTLRDQSKKEDAPCRST